MRAWLLRERVHKRNVWRWADQDAVGAWAGSAVFTLGAALVLAGTTPGAFCVASEVVSCSAFTDNLFSLPLFSPPPFLLEISSRYARIRQRFYPHDQRHHNQPRPAVDGAAHRHHLHVQPVFSLTPVQPPAATTVLSGRTHGPSATRCDQNHRHHSGTETKR